MGCRDNRAKYNCGEKHNASCTTYDGKIPEFSELEECITIEETTEELYEVVQEIKDSVDLSELGKDCIDYSDYQKGKDLKVNEALQALENELCDLKADNEGTKGLDISKLDLNCLQDPCNKSITTEQQLIQILIDSICQIKAQLNIN